MIDAPSDDPEPHGLTKSGHVEPASVSMQSVPRGDAEAGGRFDNAQDVALPGERRRVDVILQVQRPVLSIPASVIENLREPRCLTTDAAERSDTSYSPERPPWSTRMFTPNVRARRPRHSPSSRERNL